MTTSKSISLRGQTHARLKLYCERFGGSPSTVVQGFLEEYEPFADNRPPCLERALDGNTFRDTIREKTNPKPKPSARAPKSKASPESGPGAGCGAVLDPRSRLKDIHIPGVKVTPLAEPAPNLDPIPAPEPEIEPTPAPTKAPAVRVVTPVVTQPTAIVAAPEPHPVDPEPVEREPKVEAKGSDIIAPTSGGLIPFQKKTIRSGGYNEF